MKKKALIVATVVKTHIMHFHIPALKMLQEMGYETYVVAKNDYENPEDCNIPHCDHYYHIDFARFPFHPKNIKAYGQLKALIDRESFTIIHCHTPVGGVLARLAARQSRKKGTRVLYTAHGFHFFKGAPLINWLLYFPIEWLCSRWTDVLITINKEDYNRAKRCMKALVVEYIPGVGIDTDAFSPISASKDRKQLRAELNIEENATVLLSVGELNKNKNHEVVIKVLAELNDENVHYCIAGDGPLKEYLCRLSINLGISNRVHILGYRSDTVCLYRMSDIFVFPSKREGLPVALMEAMSCQLPCIASNIRGCRDLLADSENILFSSLTQNDIIKAITLSRTSVYNRDLILKRYSSMQIRQKKRSLYSTKHTHSDA